MRVVCGGYMNQCVPEEGQIGLYRARESIGDTMVPANYGKITSMALDPIERKSFRRLLPDSVILSTRSFGCSLRYPFCQNHEISMAEEEDSRTAPVSPEKLTEKTAELRIKGNVGAVYTYNEPLVGRGHVRDTGRLVGIADMKNIIVTSGNVFDQALNDILLMADAMNINLKGFTEQYYRKLDGDPEIIKHFIARPSRQCHVELAALIAPGENDSDEEMREMVGQISSLSPEIPLHVSRFFPRWRMDGRSTTDMTRACELVQITRECLKYVWIGNC